MEISESQIEELTRRVAVQAAESVRHAASLVIDEVLRIEIEAESLPHVRRRLDEIRERIVASLIATEDER